MSHDAAWAELASDWHRATDTPALDALRQRARRHGRRLAAVTVLELGITLVAAIALVYVWQRAVSLDSRLVIVGLGLFSAIAGGFTIYNRRGTWRAGQETLDGYRALEARRHVMRINAARFGWIASIVMLPPMIVLTMWRAVHEGPGTIDTGVAAAAVAYLSTWVAYARRRERRLRSLTD